jgi:hypothetical protein
VDRSMTIGPTRLIAKSGGASGSFVSPSSPVSSGSPVLSGSPVSSGAPGSEPEPDSAGDDVSVRAAATLRGGRRGAAEA